MYFDKNNKIIKRNFQESNPLEIIRVSNQLVDDFLYTNGKIIDIPINALRIIFNIISNLRNEQFIPEKQPRQLSLFEEEFETDNNVFIRMKILNKRISRQRSSKQIIKAYEFLADFKKGWYSSKNANGKEVKTYGGLISMPSYQERGFTSFLISSYWLKRLVFISEYNHILYDLVYNIRNNKHILFALWLSKLPENGTCIKRHTFNEKFGINYKCSNDLCEKFLKPIRRNLNKFNDRSFNYKYEKEMIFIIPYLTKNILDGVLSEITNENRLINQRLKYFSKRYSIASQDIVRLEYHYKKIAKSRILIEKSYKIFIENNRKRKIKSTEIKGVLFLKEIQKIMIKEYQNSETGKILPNAYPVII